MNSSYRLTLADGLDVQISAGDAEALRIVKMLAGAMMLEPGEAKHSLLILTGQESATFHMTGKTIVCGFSPLKNRDDIVSSAMQVGLAIAHLTQSRGGILVHGGLADFKGQGVILAAPGGTGKTTASTRLTAPWRSLCDDAALICRDTDGNYHGHPWPTWSRFYFNGTGGAWNTSCAVPIKALYFLSQSTNDGLEELNSSQAAAMLIESVEQANRIFDKTLAPSDIHENHRQQFSIVCRLADCLPIHRLELSLTGKFWDLIQESLEHPRSVAKISRFDGEAVAEDSPEGTATPSEVVLSGSSMYPTLKEPGFLEVHPCGQSKPRRGDVVYFRAPGSGTMVIHRVMAVQQEGLITRGDNNPHNDPDVVPLSAVVGRVATIRRDAVGCLTVRGGAAGMLDYTYAQMVRKAMILAGRIYRMVFSTNFLTGRLRFLTPRCTRFKFVYFGMMPNGQLKILSDDVCIGNYLRGVWHIDYPWRLWVNPVEAQSATQQLESARAQWLQACREEVMESSVTNELG